MKENVSGCFLLNTVYILPCLQAVDTWEAEKCSLDMYLTNKWDIIHSTCMWHSTCK